MYQITSRDVTTSEQKLLFLILQELKAINQKFDNKASNQKPEPVRPAAEGTGAKVYSCKYCGELFDNRHKMAAHVGKCSKKPN